MNQGYPYQQQGFNQQYLPISISNYAL